MRATSILSIPISKLAPLVRQIRGTALDYLGQAQPRSITKTIAELVLFSVRYIVAVMLVGQCLGISIIVAVALMSILIPIIWMAAIKRTVLFKQKVKEEYVAVKLPNVKGQRSSSQQLVYWLRESAIRVSERWR